MKRILYNISFQIFVVLVFFIVIELGSRVIAYFKFEKYSTSISTQGNSRWSSHDSTVWMNRPGYLEYDKSSQYNEYGFRVKTGEFKMPKKMENDFWVFLFGGSAVAGMGSNQNGDWIKITGIATHSPDSSIDGKLEKILQNKLKTKKVKVFNAAVASHTVFQSMQNYNRLKMLKPDWVISMDGVNDPKKIDVDQENTSIFLDSSWKSHPINNYPFKYFRKILSKSAFFCLIGEYIFFETGIIKTKKNSAADSLIISKWYNSGEQKFDLNNFHKRSPEEKNALNIFIANMKTFDDQLIKDKQKHILLIQPHLTLRNRASIRNIKEIAVYNYQYHKNVMPHSLLYDLHKHSDSIFKNRAYIKSMKNLHKSKQWVFVDYCHFTSSANQIIAENIANLITSKNK